MRYHTIDNLPLQETEWKSIGIVLLPTWSLVSFGNQCCKLFKIYGSYMNQKFIVSVFKVLALFTTFTRHIRLSEHNYVKKTCLIQSFP